MVPLWKRFKRDVCQVAKDVGASEEALADLFERIEGFFKRLDYARVDSNAAPATIQATREYASLCPASLAFMVKQLKGDL